MARVESMKTSSNRFGFLPIYKNIPTAFYFFAKNIHSHSAELQFFCDSKCFLRPQMYSIIYSAKHTSAAVIAINKHGENQTAIDK